MTWDKIALAQKSLRQVLILFLTPLILISVGGELAGLLYFGKLRELEQAVKIPVEKAVIYGAVQLLFSFAVVLIGAKAIKSVSETFHSRHTFAQCFTVVAYALSPLFLVRLLDAFPAMNPWASFGIGIVLAVTTLYHGVPRVLQPDPPHAFGLYLISALMLAGVAGLARFLTLLLLAGKIKGF